MSHTIARLNKVIIGYHEKQQLRTDYRDQLVIYSSATVMYLQKFNLHENFTATTIDFMVILICLKVV